MNYSDIAIAAARLIQAHPSQFKEAIDWWNKHYGVRATQEKDAVLTTVSQQLELSVRQAINLLDGIECLDVVIQEGASEFRSSLTPENMTVGHARKVLLISAIDRCRESDWAKIGLDEYLTDRRAPDAEHLKPSLVAPENFPWHVLTEAAWRLVSPVENSSELSGSKQAIRESDFGPMGKMPGGEKPPRVLNDDLTEPKLTPEEITSTEWWEGIDRAMELASVRAAGATGLKRIGVLFDYILEFERWPYGNDEEDGRKSSLDFHCFCHHFEQLLYDAGFDGGELIAMVREISSCAYSFARRDPSLCWNNPGHYISKLSRSQALRDLRREIDNDAIAAAKGSSVAAKESLVLKRGAVAEGQDKTQADVAPPVDVDEVLLDLGLTRDSKFSGSDKFWSKYQINDCVLRSWKSGGKIRAEKDLSDPRKRNLYYVMDAIQQRPHAFLHNMTKSSHRKSA